MIRSAMIPTSALMGPVRVSPLMGSPLNSAAVIPAGTGNTAMCSVTQLIHVNTVHVPVPLSVVTRSVSVSARVAGLELAAIKKQP